MVVEENVIVDEASSLAESGDFYSVDALGFENRKEVFYWGVVIRIPAS